jgi:chemotaxis protein methyltransferase CheR
MRLSPYEFERFRSALEEGAGLHFADDKQRLLESKLAAFGRTLGVTSGLALLERVRHSPEELQALVNALTVGESYFFRNRPHFHVLRERILPDLARSGSTRGLRIWCAGCSTGEEPYSLAMLLRDEFPDIVGAGATILATDINTEFLARAAEARYTPWSFRGVELEIIERHFAKLPDGRFQLGEDIVRMVSFRPCNLARLPLDPGEGAEFDLVVCRNVLIYFSFKLAGAVVESLIGTVRRAGYLMVGHAEAFPALQKLEALYGNGTFYYRRPLVDPRPSEAARRRSMLPIPGLSVAPPPPAKAPAPRVEPAARERAQGGPAAGTVRADAALCEARALADKGEVGEALRVLSGRVERDKVLDERIFFLLAILADESGRGEDAVRYLRQALFLDKGLIAGHYYLGTLCERDGDARSASRHFRNAGRLLAGLPEDRLLPEMGDMTAGRLREIVETRTRELEAVEK